MHARANAVSRSAVREVQDHGHVRSERVIINSCSVGKARAENVATLALKLNCGLTSVLLVTEERRCSPRKVDTERARIYLSTSFRGAMDAVTVAQDRVDTLGSLMFESVGEVWQQAAPVPAASVMKDPSRSHATNVELGQAWALKMGAFHGLPDSIQVTGRW